MELVSGTGQVIGMREQVPEANQDLAERIAGTTLHYSGYEVGDEIIGWAENLEITVSSGGIFVEALHKDATAAEKAATERANEAT
jgi:hypothetical protein